MAFLIGFLLATALLCLWLAGAWFARVLAFLIFVPFGAWGVAAALGGAGIDPATGKPIWWAFLLVWGIGAAMAWLVSGVPIYIRNRGIIELQAMAFPSVRTMPPLPAGDSFSRKTRWKFMRDVRDDPDTEPPGVPLRPWSS
jgi:hypothetical protein